MQLGFVAPEAFVVLAVERRAVVDARQDRFAVAPLDQERRQGAAHEASAPVGPDAVRVLRRHALMEFAAGRDLAERHDVADLGEELVPALVREDFAGRAALDRPAVVERVEERIAVVGIARVGVVPVGEFVVPGEPLRIALAERHRPLRVAGHRILGQRVRRLQREARHRLAELGRSTERAARRAGRDVGVGAARERGESVLQRERAGHRVDAPPVEIAARDLSVRQRLDDLGAVLACVLRLALTCTRRLGR